jgi:DNA primase
MAASSVEEIKARLDVGEVVGGVVPLKRSGRSLKGLCPFHNEKTPSFYVFPESGTWKCFGCGEGGDIFTFLQKRENLDFGEVLRLLAARAGVELPARTSRPPEAVEQDARLRSVLEQAELFYRSALEGAAGAATRAYLERRGIERRSVERFGLGYAPASGLAAHLRQATYTVDEGVEVGVLGRREDGSTYEFLRDRLVIPIHDAAGHTIGFGGRTLGEGQPKYLNGPQTRFFDKGACLFGLDLARAAIRQSGRAVIVEGYLDAVIAHQAGFENVVATLGTALTERHLDLLGRRAAEIILALDADAAGQAATMRGLEVIRAAPADTVVPVPEPRVRGFVRLQAVRRSQFKVLTLPAGLDPDDLIRRDPGEWAALVSQATPVVDYLLNRLGERHDLTGAVGKREAVDEAMDVIRDVADPVEREHYLQRLAALVAVPESALRQLLRRGRERALGQPQQESSHGSVSSLPEAYLLALDFLTDAGESDRAEPDPLSSEAAALAQLFARLPADRRTEAGLAALTEEVEPDLQPALTAVGQQLGRVVRLTAEERRREREVAALKLRQRRLQLEHQQVLALLDEPSGASNQDAQPAALLARIAAQLQEIEAALAVRNGLGSLVWRSRQAGEVLNA